MNTDTLKTFVLLADLKNYTQAANRLYVAQSTVTNRIFELEAELGKQLFIRNKKNLQLTPEGEHFLPFAHRLLELENQAAQEIKAIGHYELALNIGTTNTIYDCHLVEKTVHYTQSNPNVKMNITIGHSLPLIQLLLDKVIDAAFTFVPYIKSGVKCTPFKTDTLILVTGRANTAYVKGIAQEELVQIPYYYCDFIFPDNTCHIKDLFPKGHSFPFEIDRSANLLPYLRSGNCFSFLPESLVDNELKAGNLLQIPLIDFAAPQIISYVLVLDKNRKNEDVQKYISYNSAQ